MSFSDNKLIIVTPVYEDKNAFLILLEELRSNLVEEFSIVVVDDGSVYEPLTASIFDDFGIHGIVIRLKRNVGHQKAISIGMAYVSQFLTAEHRVVVMDSDGEDLPSSIPILLEKADKNNVDVAVAHRKSRVESKAFKFFYAIYKVFFSIMTGRSISFGNFMVLSSQSVKRLVSMPELPIHIAGSVLASKLRLYKCPLDRGARFSGSSKMNFIGLVLHGFKGLMVFAEDVLVRVGLLCGVIAIFSILGAMTAVVLKIIGFSTPGWFSVALGILVLIFMQTAILVLMTLLLTGVVRGKSILVIEDYKKYIDVVYEIT
ncbi:MAG: glycosyltransferase [Cellvibrionaceae bacterium]